MKHHLKKINTHFILRLMTERVGIYFQNQRCLSFGKFPNVDTDFHLLSFLISNLWQVDGFIIALKTDILNVYIHAIYRNILIQSRVMCKYRKKITSQKVANRQTQQ